MIIATEGIAKAIVEQRERIAELKAGLALKDKAVLDTFKAWLLMHRGVSASMAMQWHTDAKLIQEFYKIAKDHAAPGADAATEQEYPERCDQCNGRGFVECETCNGTAWPRRGCDSSAGGVQGAQGFSD